MCAAICGLLGNVCNRADIQYHLSFTRRIRMSRMDKVFLCFPYFYPLLSLFSPNAADSVENLDDQSETESVVSFRRERPRHREAMDQRGEHSAQDETALGCVQ